MTCKCGHELSEHIEADDADVIETGCLLVGCDCRLSPLEVLSTDHTALVTAARAVVEGQPLDNKLAPDNFQVSFMIEIGRMKALRDILPAAPDADGKE